MELTCAITQGVRLILILAYRMRYGDECEGKMLDAKGDSGDKVMQLIKDANTLLEVTYKQINKYFNNF